MPTLYPFLLGTVSLAAAAIGLFFFRFWRRTRDRLFLVFALAFWLLSANWIGVAFLHSGLGPEVESTYSIYLLRLLAFACIIYGIIDKNRSAGQRPSGDESGPGVGQG